MGQKHTRQTIRDIWLPKLTHPDPTVDDPPSPDIRERARATFERILAQHQPEPLQEDLQVELHDIIEAAAKSEGMVG